MDLKEGYGFVLYENTREAEDAIAHLHEYDIQGTQLKVQWARYSSYHSVRKEITDFSKRERAREEPCVVCNMPGHWAKDCPESRGVDIRSGRCFRCGEAGHLAKYCQSSNFQRENSSKPPNKFFNAQFDRADSPTRAPNDTQTGKSRGSFGNTHPIRRDHFRTNRDAATMDGRSHYYTERTNYHQSGYTPRFETEDRSRYEYAGRDSGGGFNSGMGRYEQLPPASRERGYDARSGDRGYMPPSHQQQPQHHHQQQHHPLPPRVENRIPYAEPRSGRDYHDPRGYGNNGHSGGYHQRPSYATQNNHRGGGGLTGGTGFGESNYRSSFENNPPTMPRSDISRDIGGYRRGHTTPYGRGGGPVIRARSRSPGYERHGAGGPGAGGSGGGHHYSSYGASPAFKYPPQHHQPQQHGSKVEGYYKKEERYSNYGKDSFA